MKAINKIVVSQFGFIVGSVIANTFLYVGFKIVLINYLLLTVGYLIGFWHSKN